MFALQGVPQLEGLSMCRRVGGWSGVVGRNGTNLQRGGGGGGERLGALTVAGALLVGQ